MKLTPLSQLEIVRNETQAMFPYLVEVSAPDGNIYRYANTTQDIVYEGHTFSAAYFKIDPPQKSDSGIKDAKITMSTVDQEWIVRIRGTNKRSAIRFIALIKYEKDGTLYVEPTDDITFKLTNATWNETTLQWTMKFDDMADIKMPCQKLNQFVCPALF